MYIEKRLIKTIANIFDGLSVSVRLLDADGACIVPSGGEAVSLPALVAAPGINYHIDGKCYRMLDMRPSAFLVADAQDADDLLTLADAMIAGALKGDSYGSSHSEVYRRVLLQELGGADLAARASEQQIVVDAPRCVMLFKMEKADKQSAYATMGELIPLAEGDVLVEINRHTVALVKDMAAIDDADELLQFAHAVQETLMEEAVQTVTIGIGEEKHTLSLLGESYAEARRAIEVGRIFQPETSVYVFSKLMLERFLMNAPREDSARYHALLFNRRTAKLFNDEMLQTIEMFFRKDLNLSDTARQLFIHRNTLVYRLDKVQKQTGLDLRHFDDAVSFKILYELKKCGQEKPKKID